MRLWYWRILLIPTDEHVEYGFSFWWTSQASRNLFSHHSMLSFTSNQLSRFSPYSATNGTSLQARSIWRALSKRPTSQQILCGRWRRAESNSLISSAFSNMTVKVSSSNEVGFRLQQKMQIFSLRLSFNVGVWIPYSLWNNVKLYLFSEYDYVKYWRHIGLCAQLQV